MYDTIREWPRYVRIPFPIAKASFSSLTSSACFGFYVVST